jgi:hypothetical protein
MEQKVGPLLHGNLLECKQNSNGTYDGVIVTNNENKYYFFNHPVSFPRGNCSFNIATTEKENIDFEAVNIKVEKCKILRNLSKEPLVRSGVQFFK